MSWPSNSLSRITWYSTKMRWPGTILEIIARIALTGVWPQVNDDRDHRSAVLLNDAPDIADHPPRHRRLRTVRSLKLGVDENLFNAQLHPQQTVGLPRLDGELLRVHYFDALDVVATEGKAGEIAGIVLHQNTWKQYQIRPWQSIAN